MNRTITYHKTFNLLNYSSEKIGVEIELEESDNLERSMEVAKEFVENFHKTHNPQLYSSPIQIREEVPTELPTVQSEPPTAPLSYNERVDRQRQVIIAEINACTSPESLLSYRLISGKHDEVKKAYDIKFESFKKETI